MKNIKLLFIEDDKVDQISFLRFVKEEQLPYQVTVASSINEAKAALKSDIFDIIVSDFMLGDGNAFDVLDLNLDIKTIITTGAGNEEIAVRAMKAGAQDYLIKDIDRNYLKLIPLAIDRVINLEKTEERISLINQKESEEAAIFGGAGLENTLQMVELAAVSDSPVFITGETGTGKNLIAKAIHYKRPIKNTPFISINCAAIPDNLVEGELFGYEKGAFTGAVKAKKGIFEQADGGTIQLDELGEMPMHLQSKLLGILDDKKVRRLGSESSRFVDVRVITTTSIDLEKALGKTFRHDLYYRLSVIRISIPPLRERPGDIPDLCRYLLKKLNNGHPMEISDGELGRLQQYAWPGNVRELKNILERSLILHRGKELRPSELITVGSFERSQPSLIVESPNAPVVPLVDIERNHIRQSLSRLSGNITQTSRALGISVSTLKRKLKEYSLR